VRVDEKHSELASAPFAGADRLVAPNHLLIECANALRKKVAAGDLHADDASAGYDDLTGLPFELVAVTPALTREALELGRALGHPAQDCLYLALARARAARVVTDDMKFLKAVRRHRGVAGLIRR
jgi:predicted nucleic acid-binding protein